MVSGAGNTALNAVMIKSKIQDPKNQLTEHVNSDSRLTAGLVVVDAIPNLERCAVWRQALAARKGINYPILARGSWRS